MSVDELTESVANLSIKDPTKIQKWFRGCMFRKKRLPLVLYQVQDFLIKSNVNISKENNDGRINSCIDEETIINLLSGKFQIKRPKIRMWYDILIFDKLLKWIPVNIKTTTMNTSDNTGNLAMCVYSYTNEIMDLDKSYENGKMSTVLVNKLKDKKYNYTRDYYFIVLNKTDTKDVIINSLRGLSVLTPNINNLPFQVCWNKNREFKYSPVDIKIKLFLDTLKKSKPSWKEIFISNIRKI